MAVTLRPAGAPVWEDCVVQRLHRRPRPSTTTREDFRALAAEHRVVPVTRKVLADSETPLSAYRKLAANRPGTFLLESAENGRSWSRWSFIGAGAPSALTVRDGEAVWLGHDADRTRRRAGIRSRRCAPRWTCWHRAACRGCRRCRAAWSDSSPTTWCGGWSACPSWPSTTWTCPTCCCCWPPTSPRSTTTRAPSR